MIVRVPLIGQPFGGDPGHSNYQDGEEKKAEPQWLYILNTRPSKKHDVDKKKDDDAEEKSHHWEVVCKTESEFLPQWESG
jgi:hypothetical protein